MHMLDEWIASKFAEVATKLPQLVHQDPASFSCGYNTGYKAALLDLEKYLEEGEKLISVNSNNETIYLYVISTHPRNRYEPE